MNRINLIVVVFVTLFTLNTYAQVIVIEARSAKKIYKKIAKHLGEQCSGEFCQVQAQQVQCATAMAMAKTSCLIKTKNKDASIKIDFQGIKAYSFFLALIKVTEPICTHLNGTYLICDVFVKNISCSKLGSYFKRKFYCALELDSNEDAEDNHDYLL